MESAFKIHIAFVRQRRFQQLYTLADTIIAGRFAGQTALTAIGASNAIVNILMAVSLGANAGCAVLVSRYFGARQNGRTKTTIYTALISFAILSVLLATAGVATCRLILTALKTPQEALSESIDYLNIYYFGLPFLMLYNLGTGIFPRWVTAERRLYSLCFHPSQTLCWIILWCRIRASEA